LSDDKKRVLEFFNEALVQELACVQESISRNSISAENFTDTFVASNRESLWLLGRVKSKLIDSQKIPGSLPNPTIVSYYASAVKFCNSASSLVRFEQIYFAKLL
jgi:hypothetical protein